MRDKDPNSRALSVSRKDRGAILPMGKVVQPAFWYSSQGMFTTSRWYADTLPTWVNDFNKSDFVSAIDGYEWTLLHEESVYDSPDSVAAENRGQEFLFPHVTSSDRNRRASSLSDFPVMDSITVAFALAGVNAMQLGAGNSTDFLGVSLSTTDAVGHRYGPDSRELQDQVFRVDRYIGQLMDSLFSMRDSTRILFALSADHGVTPYPELAFTGENLGRGRVDLSQVFAEARSELLAGWGLEGDAIRFASGVVTLDTARLFQRGVNVDSLVRSLREQLRSYDGVMRVDAVSDFPALIKRGDVYAHRWYNSIPDDMGAFLTVTLEPGHYWKTATSASHGMPHESDMRVPLIFMGSPFATGKYHAPARTVDLAPTLSKAAGVAPLGEVDGIPLLEAFIGELSQGIKYNPPARRTIGHQW